MKPKVPKVEQPKTPLKPERSSQARALFRPQGRRALVSAGTLTRKATTRKASLLGGA